MYWSLAVEIGFYAIVFVMLLTATFRRLPMLAWGLTLVSSTYIAIAILKMLGMAAPGTWFDVVAGYAEFLPLRHGVFFAIGIWLWMLSNRSLPRTAWIGFGAAMVFGVLEIEMRALEIQRLEATAAIGQPLAAPVLVWLAALAIIVACTRNAQSFTPRTNAGRGWLKLAGKVTYPLYLVHSATGAATMGWLVRAGMTPYLALPVTMTIVLGIATLVAVYAEPAARKPLQIGLGVLQNAALRVRQLKLLFRQTEGIPLKPG